MVAPSDPRLRVVTGQGRNGNPPKAQITFYGLRAPRHRARTSANRECAKAMCSFIYPPTLASHAPTPVLVWSCRVQTPKKALFWIFRVAGCFRRHLRGTHRDRNSGTTLDEASERQQACLTHKASIQYRGSWAGTSGHTQANEITSQKRYCQRKGSEYSLCACKFCAGSKTATHALQSPERPVRSYRQVAVYHPCDQAAAAMASAAILPSLRTTVGCRSLVGLGLGLG